MSLLILWVTESGVSSGHTFRQWKSPLPPTWAALFVSSSHTFRQRKSSRIMVKFYHNVSSGHAFRQRKRLS